MKRILVSIICACLAAVMLYSCSPASDIIKDTTAANSGFFADPGDDYLTEPKDYVIKSKNYAFFAGEYLYFFQNILTSFSADELEKFGYRDGVSLREQTVKGYGMTWFEFIDSMTLDKLKKILVACEYAAAEKTSYINEAKSYIETVKSDIKYASDGDPEGYINKLYGNDVSYQSYLNAVQMEYIFDRYYEEIYERNMWSFTDAEVSARADATTGEKDTSPIRHVVYLNAGSRGKAEDFIAELGESFTLETITELTVAYDLYATEDYVMKDTDIAPEVLEWSLSAERSEGDASVVKVEKAEYYDYYAVFYLGAGEATYLFKSRLALAAEKTDEDIADAVGSYADFKVDEKILDGINI